jgi:hypothetical protein
MTATVKMRVPRRNDPPSPRRWRLWELPVLVPLMLVNGDVALRALLAGAFDPMETTGFGTALFDVTGGALDIALLGTKARTGAGLTGPPDDLAGFSGVTAWDGAGTGDGAGAAGVTGTGGAATIGTGVCAGAAAGAGTGAGADFGGVGDALTGAPPGAGPTARLPTWMWAV